MLKIYPLNDSNILLLITEAEICRSIFFDTLQQLKFRHGCHILFECMQVAGNGYCFNEQGIIVRDTIGYKIKFDYRTEKKYDKNAPLHFVLF